MLKNRYQEILVGMGLMSLVRGIISLKRNQSILLIDDNRFTIDSYPGLFISELEILSLLRIGKKYEIPELRQLRQFIISAKVELVTESSRLKLGSSPLANIKELLRKFPDLLDESDLDNVYQEPEDKFNSYFLEEMTRYESLCYQASAKPKGGHFEFQGPSWLKTIYKRFYEKVNQEYQESKNLKFSALLHLLGLAHEEKLKTSIGALEVPFYFFRTLSPIYRLQDFFLATQLKRRLVLMGGDYKQSCIQYWQFFNNKFENLLLESFEGVISGDKVLFFSHLPEGVPFNLQSPYSVFRKTQMSPVRRPNAPFPPHAITYITDTSLLGSERPYRVLAQGSEFSYYQWPYTELPGSKPEFYDRALWQAYDLDSRLLPFQKSAVESTRTQSVTLDLRPLKREKKEELQILKRLPLDVVEDGRLISGFEYWGPFRYQSLGLLSLSYGIEGV